MLRAATICIGIMTTLLPAGQSTPWDNVLEPFLITRHSNTWFQADDVPDAGVPSMARGPDGEIVQMLQWFPNGDQSLDFIARRVSYDDGHTWTGMQSIQWSGGPKEHSTQADPSIVLLDDGTWRLYFTCQVGKDPYPATWSATSSDGLHFIWDNGKRLELDDAGLLDPSVIHFNGEYHFFAPRPGFSSGAIHAVSSDGLLFTRIDDIVIKGHDSAKFLGNPLLRGDALYFYGTLETSNAWSGVFSAYSDDAVNWTMSWMMDGELADPAAIELPGGILVFFTALHGGR